MTATVDIQGDSRDAQRAMRDLRQSVERLGGELNGQVRSATKFGLAVFGFGEAAESVRRLVDLSKRSVQAYGEANAEVAGLIAGTAERFDELGAAIGRAIVGGDQAGETFSALQGVAVELTNAVRDNEAAIGSLARNAIAGFIDVVGVAIRLGVAFANGVDGLRIAALGAAVGISQLGLAVADGVLGTVQAASRAIRDLLQNLESVIETSARVARGLGRDGLADQLDGVLSRINGMTAGANRFTTDLQGMRNSIRDTRDALADGLNREIEDLTARVGQREEYVRLAETLGDLADQYREGAITVEAYTAATREATAATAELDKVAIALEATRERENAAANAAFEKSQQLIRLQIESEMELARARKAAEAERGEEAARKLEDQQAAAEALAAANRELAATYYDIGQAVGDGTDSITQATTKAAADQLRALILRYIGEAAALGAVGRVGASIALGAAVGLMQRSLSKLGGGGSAAASGAVGLSGSNTTRTVQNINVSVAQTNGMGAGVDTTRAIADAVNQGVRRGLIEVAR